MSVTYTVCAIRRLINTFENSTSFEDAIPIAGKFTLHGGTSLDPDITRLKTSSSASDREKEGFRLALHGPKYPEKNGQKQKAVIEFLCLDKAEARKQKAAVAAMKRGPSIAARNDDGDEEDHSATGESADDGHGGTLKYLDYSTVGDSKVLSLEWRTKYACEDAGKRGDRDSNDKGGGGSSSHWGFFTWFIIMLRPPFFNFSLPSSSSVPPTQTPSYTFSLSSNENRPRLTNPPCVRSIFLGTAAYLIFGSWLNYNRYSARGWDLVPHSETIRDVPYIFKDWMRRVVNTLQGGGSRGGYSAV